MTDKTLLAQKTSVSFAKAGPAIRHSHHDMIRFWERAIRRAGLPVRLTGGFNPHPRMVFPHALGVGVASRHEEIEIEFHSPVAVEDIARRLSLACAGVLEILSAANLPPTRRGRRIRESAYFFGPWPPGVGDALPKAIEALLARREIAFRRGAPGAERLADIRPFILRLSHDPERNGVRADFAHDNSGSARPDEIVRLLAEAVGTDWRGIGMEKTGMTLE